MRQQLGGTAADFLQVWQWPPALALTHHTAEQCFSPGINLFFAANQIFAVVPAVIAETEYLLATGVGSLLFAEFGAGGRAFTRLHVHELIDTAERGGILGGGQRGA